MSRPLPGGQGVSIPTAPVLTTHLDREPDLPQLSLTQSVLYSTGGIAGGLVFTMMNNALPLFLLTYTMPLGLPAFLNPGGAMPAAIIGLLANERSFFGGLIQPLIGRLSDRTRSPIGKRSPYILFGGFTAALAIATLAFHPSFWLMLLAVTLSGVLLFVAVGPYTTLLADITPHNQRGRVGGLMSLAGVAGAIAFSVLSMQLWDVARGWVFVLVAIFVAISLTVVAFGVREPGSLALPAPDEKASRPIVREILQHRALSLYIVAMSVYWLGAGAAAPFITRFGVLELHIPEKDSFTLLLVIVLATSVGAVLSGFLADRYGHKRVLLPGLVIFALAAIAGSQVQTLGQALPVMVLVGLGNAVPTALYLPLLADLVPRSRAGASMGFANMIWSVAQPVGSVAAGVLVDASHSYRGVFLMAAACMLVAAFTLRYVHPAASAN